MRVKNIETDKIKPYPNNPRNNDEAVDKVAESIKEFGFQQPIVVDKDMVVIVGHTRLRAAKKLRLNKVPVVIADKLTDEQVKAYRLADNKVGELATWDMDSLITELDDIEADMSEFGFDDINMDEIFAEPKESIPDERDPSCQHNVFENQDFMQFPISSYYGMPQIRPTKTASNKVIRFGDRNTLSPEERKEYIVCFYYDDYKFIAAWRNPKKYIPQLMEFKAVISPDFSLYTDFPRALQILSCYRRQWCGAYWQYLGIDVIPDVVWGDRESYDYCFDGIPSGGTVAVSTVGVRNNPDWNGSNDDLFKAGYDEMMERLKPTTVIVYGHMIEGLEGNIINVPSYYESKFGRK